MIGATSGASEVAALDSPLTHRDGVRACALPATLLSKTWTGHVFQIHRILRYNQKNTNKKQKKQSSSGIHCSVSVAAGRAPGCPGQRQLTGPASWCFDAAQHALTIPGAYNSVRGIYETASRKRANK